MYLVIYEGDIEGGYYYLRPQERTPWIGDHRVFATVADALDAISQDFPLEWDRYEKRMRRETPDPEDDRIVIWKLEPGKRMTPVAHFSGWHWSTEELVVDGEPCPELVLPGDDKSLYAIAMEAM